VPNEWCGDQALLFEKPAGNLLFVGGIGGWYPEANGAKPARPAAGDIAEQVGTL
jgi:hypothetical protein